MTRLRLKQRLKQASTAQRPPSCRTNRIKAQIAAARQQAQALQSQPDSANLNLHETEIHAPFDGIITNKYVEEGSLISSSVPLYSLQDRADNWVDFKIKETDINNFTVGDKIQMQGRNDSVKLYGTVESILSRST